MDINRKKILVLLSEAHDEDMVVILNTLLKGDRSLRHMNNIIDTIEGLVSVQYCILSKGRDSISLCWTAITFAESINELNKANESIVWEEKESLWMWTKKDYRLHVLLMEKGVIQSRKILAEDGWII